MGPDYSSKDYMHGFRKEIDANIVVAEKIKEALGREAGGREIALAYTKLQEAKMWIGKVLEAQGSELPPEFQDKAE